MMGFSHSSGDQAKREIADRFLTSDVNQCEEKAQSSTVRCDSNFKPSAGRK